MLPFSPQLLPEELRDQRVLEAMERIPRRLFVPEDSRDEAERDVALAIGYGQTISQPYIVAYMTAGLAVSPGQRVLEIGTGSGYQTAILAAMGVQVYSVELIPELSRRAASALEELHLTERVHLRVGDGRFGWTQHAPYDGILCTAAPLSLPLSLIEQAKVGARIVVPIGARDQQLLRVLERGQDSLKELRHLAVRFVPLVRPEAEA
jgi:protein-L-isoaspartate(D-aspartate) O-methyltransferase